MKQNTTKSKKYIFTIIYEYKPCQYLHNRTFSDREELFAPPKLLRMYTSGKKFLYRMDVYFRTKIQFLSGPETPFRRFFSTMGGVQSCFLSNFLNMRPYTQNKQKITQISIESLQNLHEIQA